MSDDRAANVRRGRRLTVLVLAAVALAALIAGLLMRPSSGDAGLVIRVDGPRLVDGSGRPVTLVGVNRAGAEYMCTQPAGAVFDGPTDASSIEAIRGWRVNAVRVPLNESCWLGINGLPAAGLTAAGYRRAVTRYVTELNRAGLYAVVALYWSADGTRAATGSGPMPNRDHSPAFWRGVAETFRDSPGVLFDLFSEPFPDDNRATPAAWRCWRDGGTCPGVPFQAAGMSELLGVVRSAGARNVVLLSGVRDADDLSGWLAHRPPDPAGQTVAAWHSYPGNACATPDCWRSTVAPVAASVPVVATEIGQKDCRHDYVDALMRWLDERGVGYLAWAWAAHGCATFPSLISSYDGTPTEYGAGVRDHLRSRAG